MNSVSKCVQVVKNKEHAPAKTELHCLNRLWSFHCCRKLLLWAARGPNNRYLFFLLGLGLRVLPLKAFFLAKGRYELGIQEDDEPLFASQLGPPQHGWASKFRRFCGCTRRQQAKATCLYPVVQ
jgi:hypothetical protein